MVMQTEKSLLSPSAVLHQSLDKQRIVLSGTRGTSTLAALLIHVLRHYNRSFDFVLTSPIPGQNQQVSFSNAPIILIESKEKDLLEYHHHIGLITNILWSDTTGFSSEEDYVKQFELFADSSPKGGILLYCENDPLALLIGTKPRTDVLSIGYKIHPHTSENGKHFLTQGKEKIPLHFFGSQNFQNISAARELLKRIGISHEMFYAAITGYKPTLQ
jgi:UDP-N-acetylmuramate: L-alanyl-gamma-D-glutamyl-meso-diaminopimelate ligase